MSKESDQIPEELNDQQITENAVLLCPDCLQSLNPQVYYCTNCGYGNFEQHHSRFLRIATFTHLFGKIWKTVLDSKTPWWVRILCFPFIILFYPFFVILFVTSLLFRSDKKD